MNKTRIVQISILPFGLVNSYLVIGRGGAILVDSGLPQTEGKISLLLKENGLSFSDINLIVITHAHVDHAGNAAKVKALSGAPILAHQGDLKYYKREQVMDFCPTGWFGKLFLKSGLMFQSYESFEPDILLTDGEEYDLLKYGIEGRVVSTPGHTAGSISVLLNNNQALVGDMLASGLLLGGIAFKDRPKKPPFEENSEQVRDQVLKLLQAGVETFFLGHGGSLTWRDVEKYLYSQSESVALSRIRARKT